MRKGVAAAALMLAALAASQARADTVADFYRGKQINLIVGYGPGGGYDVYARLEGRHLGRYIRCQSNGCRRCGGRTRTNREGAATASRLSQEAVRREQGSRG